MSSEKDHEAKFVRYCKHRGCHAIKLEVKNDRGWQDRMVLCDGGRVLFVEMKKPGGSPSCHQIIKKRFVEALGFTSVIAYNFKQAKEALDDFLRRRPAGTKDIPKDTGDRPTPQRDDDLQSDAGL
jgi:hypothetical protein